jgi:hypothetical protein
VCTYALANQYMHRAPFSLSFSHSCVLFVSAAVVAVLLLLVVLAVAGYSMRKAIDSNTSEHQARCTSRHIGCTAVRFHLNVRVMSTLA